MNPVDDYLEMRKEAGLADLARGAWQGLKGGVKPVLQAAQGNLFGGQLGAVAPEAFDAVSRGYELGQKAQVPLAVGAGSLAMAGTILAVKKIHGAMTKQRDFKNMMQLYPQLQDAQQQRPEMFNAAYSSMRKLNPTFGRDPVVSGAYMEKMMVLNPERTGLILAEMAGQKTQSPSLSVSGLKVGPLSLK